MGDKQEITRHLTYTKLCNSVRTNTRCIHGNRCRFAHRLEDVKKAYCKWGKVCKFIGVTGEVGCYINRGKKLCSFWHPRESKESFSFRQGIRKMVKKKRVKSNSNSILTSNNWEILSV